MNRSLFLLPLLLLALSLRADPPATLPADKALADLTSFLSQRAALKDNDTAGRIALAHWAINREMWSQADDMAREVLDREPDNRVAWNLLQQTDEVVTLPSEPEVEDALKAECLHRFGHEFKTRNARHFLICYDTTDTFAAQRGGALEKAYDAFMFDFNMRKLRPNFLDKRLVVLLFQNRDDYLKYAKETEGADLSWAAGYYSQRTNRSAFYDDSTGTGAEDIQKTVDQYRAHLKDLNNQIYRASSQGQTGLANSLTVERNRTSEAITQINLQINNAVGTINNTKTVHEAAHQLAFNTGIQTRLVDYPLWLSEGLACSFETEDSSHHRGPALINPPRVADLREAFAKGKVVALEDFVAAGGPVKMDADTAGAFYAESWALFHYLYRTNRQGMENYLLAYQSLPILRALTPDKRLKLFTDAFGDDFATLQKNFLNYIRTMPAHNP